jgi:hypothetical protein
MRIKKESAVTTEEWTTAQKLAFAQLVKVSEDPLIVAVIGLSSDGSYSVMVDRAFSEQHEQAEIFDSISDLFAAMAQRNRQ